MSKKILVSGYTYVDSSALKTFDRYPERSDIYFLVPNRWPFKGGKYVSIPPLQDNIRTAKAFFSHSNYPIIGGILKGWMPIFPFVLWKIKPDVVFSASELNLLTTLYQGIFTKLLGKSHIIFTWENIPYGSKFKGLKGLMQKAIVKLNLTLCDKLVCGSKRGKQMIEKLTDKPIAVIPFSGVETEFFTKNHSTKSFRRVDYRDSLVFSFAGAIGYRKGIHLIINAFMEVLKKIDNAVLLIAGSGEYEEQISDLIKKTGLQEHVKRFSWLNREELREFFNASDVFVYPSIPHKGWEEQFGYSLAEASSMELPIISTNTGSISELIIDGKTGILIEPDNIQQLEKAMLDLADDKNKRKDMGMAGRRFVVDTYDNKSIVIKFYDFFNN